jgi:hypothetical protein
MDDYNMQLKWTTKDNKRTFNSLYSLPISVSVNDRTKIFEQKGKVLSVTGRRDP